MTKLEFIRKSTETHGLIKLIIVYAWAEIGYHEQ